MPSFFSRLGRYAHDGRQGENQLSETFAACFEESAGFRAAVLDELWSRCELKGPPPSGAGWTCNTQVWTGAGENRLDIVLTPPSLNGSERRIIIESKLGAPLKEEQLVRYRERGSVVIVATRCFPEVSPKRLRRLGIHAIRWHHLHSRLVSTRQRSAADRFVIRAFADYLEENGMSGQALTRTDLLGLQNTFRRIAGPPTTDGVRLGFTGAVILMAMLDDTARNVRDMLGSPERFKQWGPGYYKEDYADGASVVHQFGFTLEPRTSHEAAYGLEIWMAFPERRTRYPYLWAQLTRANEHESGVYERWGMQKLASRNKPLTTEELMTRLVPVIRRWLRRLVGQPSSERRPTSV